MDLAVKNAGRETQIAWDYAITIDRNSPLVATIGTAIGLTDSQIDDLFILAATL